jgi:CBS domain
MRRAYRTFRFLFEREPWVFEVIFGFFTAVFFLLLWVDWRDGPAFGSIVVLSEVRPEDFWKWAGIGGGAFQCGAAIASDRGVPYLKWPRWICAGWLSGLWGAMSAAAWIAAPFTPTAAIYAACVAHVLEEKRLKRVPVLRQGRLVGLVSRADLLKALLDPPATIKADTKIEDERILRAIEVERGRQPWSEGAFVFVDVRDGVVRLYGIV